MIAPYFSNRQCTAQKEYPLNPILQVDKDEWEAFLSEFSKLTKNYELILSRLELAHTQMMAVNRRNESLTRELQTLVQSPHHDAAVSGKNQLEEPRRREPENQSTDVEPTIKSKPGLLGFLRAELSRISRRQTPTRTYASCRRCGFRSQSGRGRAS